MLSSCRQKVFVAPVNNTFADVNMPAMVRASALASPPPMTICREIVSTRWSGCVKADSKGQARLQQPSSSDQVIVIGILRDGAFCMCEVYIRPVA